MKRNAYNIQEVARLLGITTNKIRFYEKKGLISPSRNEENEYRYFTDEEVIKIHTILLYRQLGMKISDIKVLLGTTDKSNYLEHFYNQWKVVNDEVHRLSQTRMALEKIMDTMYMTTDDAYEAKILEEIQNHTEKIQLKNNWRDKWDFDNWARNYDTDVRKDKGELKIYQYYDRVLETVVSEVGRYKDTRSNILEIGIGTGELANKFYQEGYEIIGVDQSRAMLEVTKSKNKMLKVRLGEFMKLPFENKTFDVIVSTYAFHHLKDKEKEIAIDEMMRVLKENGIIVIGDLMFESEQAKNLLYNELTSNQIETIEDEYYTDIYKLKKYVAAYNKTIESIQIDRLCWVITIR